MNQLAPDLTAGLPPKPAADDQSRPGTPAPSARSTARVSTHLVLLSLGIALPLLIMSVILVNALLDAQRLSARVSLDSGSKLLATLTDSELETSMALVAALGQTQTLREGNLDQFRQQASFRLQFLHGSWLNVTTADGTVVTSTLERAGATAIPDTDAKTRARAIASGKPEVSDLVETGNGGEPVAFVSMAIPGASGATAYVLSISVPSSRIAAMIADKYEPNVLVGILDRNHRFVARIPDHQGRVGALASASWREQIVASPSGLVPGRNLEGEETLLSYRPTLYGWTVGVAYRRTVVEAPHVFVRRTIWAISAVLLVVGGILTYLFSVRITRPAKQLLEASSCLADMRPVTTAPTGVSEFDAVIRHFAQVAEMLSQRDQALRQSEQRLRTALEAAESGTWTWDTRTDLRTVDARNRAIMGFDPGEEVDTPKILSTVHPEDSEMLRRAMLAAIDPKGSGLFRVEYRIRKPSGEERWIISQARTQFDEDGHARLVGIIRDITHRKIAEQKIRFLMQEAVHRSKNLLAVVQAIANRTARGGELETFLPRFIDRINGLSASQDLLIGSDWGSVGLAALVDAHLAGHSDLFGTRIIVSGPPLLLRPEAVQSIGMALHELATNATKYGALSNAEGKVAITWRMASGCEPPRFMIEWRETGGPPAVEPDPERRGFGQIVIGRMVETALKGKSELTFENGGLLWRLNADPAMTLDPGWARERPLEAEV